jgi:hypothetical protein
MCRSGSALGGAYNVCAYEEAEESIKRAVREAGRPVVKVEVEMKGKW